MDKKEILEKSQSKRAIIGEMEKAKTNNASWISLIVTGVLAVALIIAEGALGHFSSVFAIASICYIWASVFYFCQYFVAKRPWPVLFGAILHGGAGIAMIVLYILTVAGIIL